WVLIGQAGSGRWDRVHRGGTPGRSTPRVLSSMRYGVRLPSQTRALTVLGDLVPGLGNPIRAGDPMVSEHQAQMGGMFLKVTHTVELQLQESRLHPAEGANSVCLLIRQPLDGGFRFLTTVHEIAANRLFGIRLFGERTTDEWRRRHEAFGRAA